VRYEVASIVRASPASVWGWWTDHGPPGTRERISHGFGSSMRTVVSREGDVLVLRETVAGVPVLTHRVELHAAQRAFKEEARAFTAWWRFEDAPEGTRVRREVETRAWAPRWLVRWAAQRDLDHHARECERAL